jgi:hypothetical protein
LKSLRWWNGKYWSSYAQDGYSEQKAEREAKTMSAAPQHIIEWRERAEWWPERSRT